MESFIESGLNAVREMIGRIPAFKDLYKQNTVLNKLYGAGPTMTYDRVNYHLTKAIYYCSTVQDPASSASYGKEYILGAIFGKPIVNITAGFIMGKLPTVETGNDELDKQVKVFLEENKSKLYRIVRNWLRDGDAFPEIRNDLTLALIPAYQIEIVDDPITGEILGYNRTQKVDMYDKDGVKQTYQLLVEYRKRSPFRVVYRYKDNDEKTKEEITAYRVSGNENQQLGLSIVHFSNEREDDQRYGNTEYQNLYIHMANYTAVLEAAIENNIYNSKSTPVLSGIDNVAKFMQANGVKNSDGTYSLTWDGQKVLMGGKEFKASMLTGPMNASDAQTLLGVLFWCICQGSETPEFIFGTAVSSSKASVSEQMPAFIHKIERKQTELVEPLVELIKAYLNKAKQFDATIPDFKSVTIKWEPLTDEDGALQLDVLKFLKETGIITDKTTLEILMNTKIKDIDKELKDAVEETAKKAEATAQGDSLQPANELASTGTTLTDDQLKAGLTPEQLQIASKLA